MSFEGERLGHARKTEGNMFPNFKIPLRRRLPNLHGFLKKFLVAQCSIFANVRHIFGPAFLGFQQIFGKVGCNAEHPRLQRRFAPEHADLRLRLDVGVLNDILRILHAGSHAQEKGFQFTLKYLKF